MERTQLEAVERNGHWTVGITWPNGGKHHVGRYAERREADKWIAEHAWMIAERIEEDMPPRNGKGRPRKRPLTPPADSTGNPGSKPE
jgi:hypothetical protein